MTQPATSQPKQIRTVQTSRFGAIEVDDNKVITMTSPILGFPDEKLFALLPHNPDSAFFWFQAIDNPELAFIVIAPEYLRNDYKPPISGTVRKELQLSSTEETVELMVILTIPPGRPQETTANFLGPIMLNPQKRLAKQVVLDPKQFDPCWPVSFGKTKNDASAE